MQRGVVKWAAAVLVMGGSGCGLTSFNLPVDATDIDVQALVELQTTAACTGIAVDERLAAVSPEGHAWFLTPTADGPRFRIVDPYGTESPTTLTLEMPEIQQMRAWSADRATFVAGSTVWRLPDGASRVRLAEPPVPVQDEVPWCGELDVNGVLVTDGQWVEQQNDTWYVWRPTADDAPLTKLLARDGQCTGPDGLAWGVSDDGRLWRVSADRAEFFEGFDRWTSSSASATDLGILVDGTRLWVGEPDRWVGYEFPGAQPFTEVVGASDALWLASSNNVLRLRDGVFERVPSDLDGPTAEVWPHSGGAWVISDSRACHQADGPTIRVEGIRPHQTVFDPVYDFTIEVVMPGGEGDLEGWTITAVVDDAPVALTPEPEGRVRATGSFDGAGISFTLMATQQDETLTRTVSLTKLRLPGQRSWELDIKPLYEGHCAQCHVTGGVSSPLETYEAWVGRAEAIESRVLDVGDMPPGDPEFGDSERTILREWLNSGLAP